MLKIVLSMSIVLSSAVVLACDQHAAATTTAANTGAAATKAAAAPKAAPVTVAVAKLSVDEVQALLTAKVEKKEAVTVVDCNSPETRASKGVIPGAVMFTSATPLAGLPANKAEPLVYYCASEACGASEQAANKAVEGGYTAVKVLPVGIAGWVKAGKKVDKPVG
jgi:rhodanese-related sulfurtransferase